jgi:hypothetical protein
LNLIPDRPFASRIHQPLVRLADLDLRMRLHANCARLDRRIRRGHALLAGIRWETGLSDGAPLARELIQTRALVVEQLAADAFDVMRLMNAAGPLAARARSEEDPFFAGLAGAVDADVLAMRLPYRSCRELSLEVPRFGEGERLDPDPMRQAFAVRGRWFAAPSTTSAHERLLRLQAMARDNLSYGAALLRYRFLALARSTGLKPEEVFELAMRDLGRIAGGEEWDPSSPAPVLPDRRPPARWTLGSLEAWAAGDGPVRTQHASAVWVSGSGPLTGVIPPRSHDADPGTPEILLLRHPTVEAVARANIGSIIVAMGGNRLCHAAMIARAKGLPALFGAEPYWPILRPGARLRLEADGTILAD